MSDNKNFLGQNSFSKFYSWPEDERVTLQYIPNINPASQIPLKLKALLLNSQKQATSPTRYAPKVFESLCIYDVNNSGQKTGTYTVYLLRESFHGDLSFVFDTDPIFFKYMNKVETRIEFYIKIFEAYQQLHLNKLKHCDIRPENIFYKQIEENNFIPVFANFNQITQYKTFCPDGELAYMSPEENALDITFASDSQKKKTELFSLALTILEIETNYVQRFYTKYMYSSLVKMDPSLGIPKGNIFEFI
jgi:serine/threonine protein kinase